MSMDRFQEKFASSLIELALVRKGFQVHKEHVGEHGRRVDLAVMKPGKEVSFVVEVKWARSMSAVKGESRKVTGSHKVKIPRYSAYVIGDGDSVYVSPGLKSKVGAVQGKFKVIPDMSMKVS